MTGRSNVRGFLFDLGDVESILQGHSAVRDAVVSYQEDIGDAPGLVAYIVLNTPAGIAVSFGTAELIKELRRLVRSKLPDYMLPCRFAVLEASRARRMAGWTMRHCLHRRKPIAHSRIMWLRGTRQRKFLPRMWQELLKLTKVSVKDNFFDLGGQSLMAVRLFNEIEQEFGRRFPLAMLFRAPTIDQLARKLTAGEDAGVGVGFFGSNPTTRVQSRRFSSFMAREETCCFTGRWPSVWNLNIRFMAFSLKDLMDKANRC